MSGNGFGARARSPLEQFQLAGQVALVTGASRGIGRAISLGLAGAGCDVVVASRTLPDLESLAKEIASMGRRALPVCADLRNVEEIDAMVGEAGTEFGRIDILVNNAGANAAFGSVFDIDEKAWDETTALDVKAYFFVSRAVGRIMKERGGGRIVNIASVSGLRPAVNMGVYCVCKAGVLMLTQVLAQEWGKYHIRVNAIAPGQVKTSFSQAVWGNPELRKKEEEFISVGHIATPEELVGATLFLASEASSYMTGQTVVMDGGRFLKHG